MPQNKWALILVIWGDKYHKGYVNTLVRSSLELSSHCDQVIMFTDVIRSGISAPVEQVLIPNDMRGPKFFRPGYPVKLCFMDTRSLPLNKTCVYIDLDTLVLGNLDRVAALCKTKSDVHMLAPAGLKFNRLSRFIFRTTGKNYVTGNSSITVFNSGLDINVAQKFISDISRDPAPRPKHMNNDDRYIAHTLQQNLRNIPTHICAMFRRKYLTRFSWLRREHPAQDNIVAVTLNDLSFKPDKILGWQDGQKIIDPKGRSGEWSERWFGKAQSQIRRRCLEIESGE